MQNWEYYEAKWIVSNCICTLFLNCQCSLSHTFLNYACILTFALCSRSGSASSLLYACLYFTIIILIRGLSQISSFIYKETQYNSSDQFTFYVIYVWTLMHLFRCFCTSVFQSASVEESCKVGRVFLLYDKTLAHTSAMLWCLLQLNMATNYYPIHHICQI